MIFAAPQIAKTQNQPTLISVTNDFLPLFSKVLKNQKSEDPFLFSAAYFLMTGRNGLWLYGDEETAMVIARHPNLPDTLLYFPPFGKDPVSLINRAHQDPAMPPGRIQIARIPLEGSKIIEQLKISCGAKIVQETVLDWAYPVHAVSVKNVIQHRGQAFKNFRNHIYKLNDIPSRVERINPSIHAEDIMRIASQWAHDGRKDGFSYDDLVGPVQKVLSLMPDKELNIAGIIISHNNQPTSYMLWSSTKGMTNIAIPLVRVSIGHMNGITGTAEFSMLKTMEILAEDGFDYMYLGGSETAELDRFKRKLAPVKSIPLGSAIISRPSHAA